MLFLSGLLGMMALGSVAIVGVGTFEEDDPSDDWPDDPGGGSVPEDDVDLTATKVPPLDDGQWPLPDDGIYDQGRSLFARMGLINLMTEIEGEAGASGGAPATEVLSLEAFEVANEVPAVEPHEPDADLLAFDIDEEQLLIIYDDSAGTGDPALELRVSEDDPAKTEIVVDGAVLGHLHSDEAPPLSSIVLLGESAAGALALG
ncbi:hypothetical protein [Antarctobacter jejuensis]|uniref:hypothetical protein n=1 Tax=Antarctobacter jejuensis TaxID=1439938 RepID=UPI003FD6922B